jgi:hypothetical protein
MKKLLKLSMCLVSTFFLMRCSDPLTDEPAIDDDKATRMSLYADKFFTIGLTTNQAHPDDAQPQPIEFHLNGNGGRISVNWGDGTIENFVATSEPLTLAHQYQDVKDYTVQMSGEITTITSFSAGYGSCKFNSFHFGGLVNLSSVSIVLNEVPSTLNFARNRKLESVQLSGLETLTDLILPPVNVIRNISIDGNTKLSTSIVDRIIARVYDSVKSSPRAGSFNLSAVLYEDPATQMVGPPSSYSVNKLRILQNTYGWTINPVIQ